MATTTVHLIRHGEVENPTGVLYGRLPGFHLSDLGQQMARRVGEVLSAREIAVVVSSPLERARETAAPLAQLRGVEVVIDDGLIEAGNVFEGKTFGVGDGSLKRPAHWRHLWNPMRPSWGEPYVVIARRMTAALAAARDAARAAGPGSEAACVSHQLPVWTARSHAEGRRLWHDPRNRQCTLASVTTFTYDGDKIVAVAYSEPAKDLLPVRLAGKPAAGA